MRLLSRAFVSSLLLCAASLCAAQNSMLAFPGAGSSGLFLTGGANSSSGASCITSSFTATVGTTIVASGVSTNGATGVTPALSDGLGNTVGANVYTGEDSGTHSTLTIWIYHVTAGGSDSLTYTDGNGSSFWKSCAAGEWSGSLTLDKNAPATISTFGNVVSGTTATTTHSTEVLIGVFSGDSGGTTWTQGSGWLSRETGDIGGGSTLFMEDKNVLATGTYQSTANTGSTEHGIGQIVTLF